MDVQAVLTVLGRRRPVPGEPPLDLLEVRLERYNLTRANFTGADLRGADLTRADHRRAVVSKQQLAAARGVDPNYL
ncbi:MAG: pentapeptide repeat-containing protein [Frankiaceae bacterium]